MDRRNVNQLIRRKQSMKHHFVNRRGGNKTYWNRVIKKTRITIPRVTVRSRLRINKVKRQVLLKRIHDREERRRLRAINRMTPEDWRAYHTLVNLLPKVSPVKYINEEEHDESFSSGIECEDEEEDANDANGEEEMEDREPEVEDGDGSEEEGDDSQQEDED